jgi:hypothetical protein
MYIYSSIIHWNFTKYILLITWNPYFFMIVVMQVERVFFQMMITIVNIKWNFKNSLNYVNRIHMSKNHFWIDLGKFLGDSYTL